MIEDRLNRFRKPPRPAFAAALQERLHAMKTPTPQPRRAPRLAPYVLGGLGALALALALSPAAQAAVQQAIQTIGGMTFITAPVSPSANQPAAAEEEVASVPSETLGLEAAQARLPYELRLPAWTPDGYVWDGQVVVEDFGDAVMAHTTWSGPENAGLWMDVSPASTNWVVGEPGAEEVLVNGQPAGLVRGGWNADTNQWDESFGTTLHYQHNGVRYQIHGYNLSVETLIRVAESIP